MRVKRSDYNGEHMWSFKQEIRKKITNFNRTIKKIGAHYYKNEVERLSHLPEFQGRKQDIKNLAKQGRKTYEEALKASYSEEFSFLKSLKQEKLDQGTGQYIVNWVNTDIGKAQVSLSREGNFNLSALQLFKDRAGSWDKIQDVTMGITPDQLSDFVEFLVADGTITRSDRFFYEFLDQDISGVSNQEVIDKIMEYYEQENISNPIVNALNNTPMILSSTIPMGFITYEDYAAYEYIRYFHRM